MCVWYCCVLPFLRILGLHITEPALSLFSADTMRTPLRLKLYTELMAVQYSAATGLTSWLVCIYESEEKMVFLDSALLEKISWKKDLWFAVMKLVDVGIVLMKQCLVLFPEMCLSLVLSW